MNREVHVRFCERLRGEIPLCLLDFLICIVSLSQISRCQLACCNESRGIFLNCLLMKLLIPNIYSLQGLRVGIVSTYPYLQTKLQFRNYLFQSWRHPKTYNLLLQVFSIFLLLLSYKSIDDLYNHFQFLLYKAKSHFRESSAVLARPE